VSKFVEKGGGRKQLERINSSLRRTYGAGPRSCLVLSCLSGSPAPRSCCGGQWSRLLVNPLDLHHTAPATRAVRADAALHH